SDQTGRSEVYVREFPPLDHGQNSRPPLSIAGGRRPRWPRGGSEVFYIDPDNNLMVVRVRAGATFEAESPVRLFRIWDIGVRPFDVSPDGQRVLVATPVDNAAVNRIVHR